MTTTHRGFYNWGSARQTTSERIQRAQIDLENAAAALDQAEPGTATFRVMAARYDRALAQLAELEARDA